jgi:hypothetical protein
MRHRVVWKRRTDISEEYVVSVFTAHIIIIIIITIIIII